MWGAKVHPVLIVIATSFLIATGILTYYVITKEQQTTKTLDSIISETTSHGDCQEVCQTKACVLAAATLLKNMDESVDPCDNFYKFSCGNYERETVIPAGKLLASSLDEISNKLDEQVWRLLDQPVVESEPKVFKLVKNFYQSCMNTSEIENKGKEPLFELLKQLGGWPVVKGDSWNESSFSWTDTTFRLQQLGFLDNYLIDLNPNIDKKNSSRRHLTLDQPTLSLQREYLVSSSKMLEPHVLDYWNYQKLVATILGADLSRATMDMENVIKFEMKLAELTLDIPERYNMFGDYNPMTIGEMQKKWPDVQWLDLINNLMPEKVKFNESQVILINAPKYFDGFGKLMKETEKRTQANYLLWRAVSSSLSCMPENLRRAQLEFLSKASSGPEQREPRWKECSAVVGESLAIAVGALYIRHYFKEEYKQEVTEIVDDLKNSFLKMLEQVDWMDDITKNLAIEKLKKMYVHVGYPIELLNDTMLEEFYNGVELSSADYFGNNLNITKFSTHQTYSFLLKPVNSTDWKTHGKSAVANAFHDVHENSVEIPAGILQGIFYGSGKPKYMNYGAIGMAIGHEITHGFDDKGAQYDVHGNLNNWWEESTKKAFLNRTQCMIAQYGNYYVPEINIDLNGVNTKNENIADNGGIKEAYSAYQAWVKRHKKPEYRLPGLNKYTPNQLFWLSAGNAWCSKYTEGHLRFRVNVGNHPPSEFRVNGALSNMNAFARDFNCSLGRKMNPINKCSLW